MSVNGPLFRLREFFAKRTTKERKRDKGQPLLDRQFLNGTFAIVAVGVAWVHLSTNLEVIPTEIDANETFSATFAIRNDEVVAIQDVSVRCELLTGRFESDRRMEPTTLLNSGLEESQTIPSKQIGTTTCRSDVLTMNDSLIAADLQILVRYRLALWPFPVQHQFRFQTNRVPIPHGSWHWNPQES